jgi:GTP-dependent phosphoenolpyruvate carboxykinase
VSGGSELIELNQQKLPGCYLHRSATHDVARTEHLTFVCTREQDDAGPNNNWMAPDDARAKLTPLFSGSMKGRTMYVVPFLMGPPGSRFSKVGVEITDSKYVVLSMRIMTRVGQVALDQLQDPEDFTHCLHSLGDSVPIAGSSCTSRGQHGLVVGSGYGGNALLGRSAWRCVWRACWRATRGGSRSTCCCSASRIRTGAPATWPARSVGVRQDQPCDARAARGDARLEGAHRRRRHRVDPSRARTGGSMP